jgi:radical SAM superfamily enzyme YgiQ (UPF0313 family)
MKVTLISPYPDITAFGLRTISAHIKAHGVSTRLIFVPDPFGDHIQHGVDRYAPAVMDELVSLCEGSDLIGITLMTNFYDGACQMTRAIKTRLKTPVIWGGVHPTIRPEESLQDADIVCVGDGEDAMLDLCRTIETGGDISSIENLWVRTPGGGVKQNSLRPLVRDLDVYPLPDYSLDDHHAMFEGSIRRMDDALMRRLLERGTVSEHLGKVGYQTMTGRGCPHKCTYCINDTLKNMYKGQVCLRWRSTEHVLRELSWVRERMPYVGYVWISDDAFFARKSTDLKEFCAEYKKRIGLPFTCLASPLTVNEEKMALLTDAGLLYIQMGVETGSARIQEIFNRKAMSNERVLKAARIINKYRDRMFPPSYDFILDIPYETNQDKIDTIRLIADLPKPYKLQPFSLVLSPGTELYEMAKRDGFIGNERREMYSKTWAMREMSYFNFLIMLSKNGRFPSPLLRLLTTRPLVAVMNSALLRPLYKRVYGLLRTVKRALFGIVRGKR